MGKMPVVSEKHSSRVGARPHPLCEFWAFPSLERGASAGWSSHVKELLQQPKLKTPSKLRKSQVQTNNYKAGGREGKQPQAFLK